MRKKIVIDCDPGVDDALALILAFHSPEVRVLAITGVSGNVSLPKVMINIRRVLTLLQPSPPPWVAQGAERPLKGNPQYAESFHGQDGLGGAKMREHRGGSGGRIFLALPTNSFPGWLASTIRRSLSSPSAL